MWKYYALLSALFAALTAIFAKVGVKGINSDLATAIRTLVILLITWGIVFFGNFSYPLASRLLVGSKLLAGYGHYSACDLSTVTIGNRGGMSMETGGSMTFLAKQNLGVKFFLDYSLTPVAAPSDKKCTQILTVGSSISVTF